MGVFRHAIACSKSINLVGFQEVIGMSQAFLIFPKLLSTGFWVRSQVGCLLPYFGVVSACLSHCISRFIENDPCRTCAGGVAVLFPLTHFFGERQLETIIEGDFTIASLMILAIAKILAISVTVTGGW
ncbi:MAG TPA: hypothetical protein V6C84_26805 [Coleofasciculaceae cyanobacterium]